MLPTMSEAANRRMDSPIPASPLAVVDHDHRIIRSGAREILTAVGEVIYEWSIGDDTIRWGGNALEVLKVASLDQIATGRAFTALLDPNHPGSRHDAVLNSPTADEGRGVPYQVQYSLAVDGQGGRTKLWIEDIGRWYAGETGAPARAHGVLRVINDRHEQEERLAFLSRYDELTGFSNRAHLLETLGEAIVSARRFRSSVSFLIVAIDNFRAINEAYGFDVADQVLAAVARRIGGALRQGDAAGRYSGNKLGLVLMNSDERNMHTAAERFHALVRDEVVITEAGAVAVTVSIGGVALPRHGRTVTDAMARAQEALHFTRLRGSGRFAAYTHSPARQARRRDNAELSSELVAAFNENRFSLAFQPVADAKTRAPVFHEALLRLARPNRPTSSAGDFIALSERLGLIRLIDRRALDLVFQTAAASPSRLSFNVSAETVADSEWLAHFSGILSRSPDISARLIVEITETAIMRNLDEATRFVALLHDLGCQLAIDDFGAGFSSFRSLRELDVDLVKIDGAFVENLTRNHDDQVFARALIELARNFDIKTVAEKVQDEETARVLTEWGVDYLQGNLTGAANNDRLMTATGPASG
jgi:diguanylate cyclase (GGDEF)-like protein